jgi:hypothetical protein
MPRSQHADRPTPFIRLLALGSVALCALGAALPAAAYDIDLQREVSGMKVTIDATGGPNAKVVINNRDKVSAHCRVEFQGGKGANAVRAGVAKVGKRLILTAPMPPELEKLRINATCKPPKGKGEAAN